MVRLIELQNHTNTLFSPQLRLILYYEFLEKFDGEFKPRNQQGLYKKPGLS